ncbi:MAG: hypothetical protein KJ015_36645 [Myxococcales bacterium]|nr:hypothetical protein [Myxococcales bacterium]
MRRIWGSELVACALALTLTSAALAQEDDANRNAARELAEQAAKAMEAEDWAKAQDLYQRAYALVPAPTLSLRHARALAKGGRWVEALEAYVRTTRTRLDASSPPAFREAVEQAQTELAELRPRVPRAVVVVKGIDPKSKALAVSVDGRPLAAALLGVPAPFDPGKHELVAKTSDGREAHATLEIQEKEEKSVELVLPPAPEGTAPDAEPGEPSAQGSTAKSSQKTWAFVALGAGAVGLGVGVTTGLMATSKHQSAEDACPNGQCAAGSSGADDAEAFRSLRTVSTIGYVVAVVGVGAGVTLWLTSPERTEQARVGAWLGPQSAGIRGRF